MRHRYLSLLVCLLLVALALAATAETAPIVAPNPLRSRPTATPAPEQEPTATPAPEGRTVPPTASPEQEPTATPAPEGRTVPPTASPEKEPTATPAPEGRTVPPTASPTQEPTAAPTPLATIAPAPARQMPTVAAPTATPEDEYPLDTDYLPDEDEEDVSDAEPTEEELFVDALIEDANLPENALDAVNGMTHILLIGLDARPRQTTGRSDTMIILTLDAKHNCIKMTSLMRDLYVEIPGRKNNRLNAAYVYGGAELLAQTIEQNFGIKIDHYVAVNFSILADVIDQLGGLTLTVEEKYVPRINAVIKQDNKVLGLKSSDGFLKGSGEMLLTGKQAQAYARYRYGTKDGDFGRTVRQREVVLKALDKVKAMSMPALVQLGLNNIDKVTTDMSILDMVQLAPAAFQLRTAEVRELRIPINEGYASKTISGMAVLVPDRPKNKQAIAEFLLEDTAHAQGD